MVIIAVDSAIDFSACSYYFAYFFACMCSGLFRCFSAVSFVLNFVPHTQHLNSPDFRAFMDVDILGSEICAGEGAARPLGICDAEDS